MPRRATPMVLLIFAAALASCDDDEPTCESSTACETAGEERCQGTEIWVCQEEAAGCLAFAAVEDCADRDPPASCELEAGAAACVCEDECAGIDEIRCEGTIVMVCSEGADGCYHWTISEDCADRDPPTICRDDGMGAWCVEECTGECEAVDDTQCDGTIVQTCTADADGCLVWLPDEDCADRDPPAACGDVGGEAGCVVACDDECDAAGDSRCNADAVETCTLGDGGCLAWVVTEDCTAAEPPMVCDDGSGTPTCVASCVDECDDEGALRCEGDSIETCAADADGCLDWLVTEDCAAGDPSGQCDDSSGTPTCVVPCVDECAVVDEVRCEAGVLQTCTAIPDACLEWVDGAACVELCAGAVDEDLDGDVDCADSDCAADPGCGLRLGFYEAFGEGDLNDLTGCTVTFTPDLAAPNRYTVATACECGADWIVGPYEAMATTGVTTVFSLTTDACEAYSFFVNEELPFFGYAQTDFFVCSNGFVTFGAGDSTANPLRTNFFAYPRIAPLDADLDPSASAAGAVVVDEMADLVAVSWADVPVVGGGEVSAQLVLRSSGVIELLLLEVGPGDRGTVGIAEGFTGTVPPDESNYLAAPFPCP